MAVVAIAATATDRPRRADLLDSDPGSDDPDSDTAASSTGGAGQTVTS
jgi:hypothetical protein